MSGSALVNLGNVGDLSRPATVLIERISDAIGGVAKPWQIKRVAEAETQAQRIRTESELELSDLRLRAGHRFIAEQTRIQMNIEDITRKSVPNLNDDSSPEELEDDWIVNFFDKSRNISDDDMQSLWSRILAGEANNPGLFSRKTVNLIADLERQDVEIFIELCRFVWTIEDRLCPLVFDFGDEIYSLNSVSLDSSNHLQSLGLITISSSGYSLFGLPKVVTSSYCGRSVTLSVPNEADNKIEAGMIVFTQSGQELARICEVTAVDGFFAYVYGIWEGESLVRPRESS